MLGNYRNVKWYQCNQSSTISKYKKIDYMSDYYFMWLEHIHKFIDKYKFLKCLDVTLIVKHIRVIYCYSTQEIFISVSKFFVIIYIFLKLLYQSMSICF